MFESGEGAVSTGPMVPVYDAQDVGIASEVAELLSAHAIPAIVDAELAGLTGLAPRETPCVYVPSSMLPAAKALLQEHRGDDKAPAPEEAAALLTWVPAKVVGTTPPLPAPVEPRPEAFEPRPAPEEEEEAPLEVPSPDPGPLGPRLAFALGAIAFGLGLQRILELVIGAPATARALGASRPLAEHAWTLVTAGFVHGSFGHMASNAAFGLLIGVVLFGTHRVGATACVWLLGSIAGIGAELMMSPGALVVGASAGNYALVGLWAFGQLERARVVPLPRRERLRTIGVLLLLVPGAFTPFSSSGTKIAVLAHGVGFLAGLILGAVFARRLLPEGFAAIGRRARIGGALAVIVTVGATAAALLDTLP